jgi:hypothetical protein
VTEVMQPFRRSDRRFVVENARSLWVIHGGSRVPARTAYAKQGQGEAGSPFHSTTSQLQMYLDIMIVFIQLMPILTEE